MVLLIDLQGVNNQEQLHEIIYNLLLKQGVKDGMLYSRLLLDGRYTYEVYKDTGEQVCLKYNQTTGAIEIDIHLNYFFSRKDLFDRIHHIFQSYIKLNQDLKESNPNLTYNSEVSFWENHPLFKRVIDDLHLEFKPPLFNWCSTIAPTISSDSLYSVLNTLLENSIHCNAVFKLFWKKTYVLEEEDIGKNKQETFGDLSLIKEDVNQVATYRLEMETVDEWVINEQDENEFILPGDWKVN